jgi:hypothetical protein
VERDEYVEYDAERGRDMAAGECLIEDGTLDGLLVSRGMKAKTGVYNKEKLGR